MIISRTPFRISFFGGGTDYPEYYREYGGATLLTGIDKYCYLSIHPISLLFKHRFQAHYSKTEQVQAPGEFSHPLIRECLGLLGVDEPMEVSHMADLPGQTGLGSSSSFTVGLLNALHAWRGDCAPPETLAREAIEVERERVGDSGGHQDQYAAAYGGFIRVNFMPGGQVQIKGLALSPARMRELEARLLFFYLGTEQSAETVVREQKQKTQQNLAALKTMHVMVDRAEDLLAGTGSLDPFGHLLHEAWLLKKGLSSGISNPAIDRAYEQGMRAGAYGGKLLGAGGRGFMMFYVDPERHDAVRQAVSDLKEVQIKFSAHGSGIIFNH